MSNELLTIDPVDLQFPCKPYFFLNFSMIRICLRSNFFRISCNDFVISFFGCVVELKKQISCSLYLGNKTDNYVAFKVNFNF